MSKCRACPAEQLCTVQHGVIGLCWPWSQVSVGVITRSSSYSWSPVINLAKCDESNASSYCMNEPKPSTKRPIPSGYTVCPGPNERVLSILHTPGEAYQPHPIYIFLFYLSYELQINYESGSHARSGPRLNNSVGSPPDATTRKNWTRVESLYHTFFPECGTTLALSRIRGHMSPLCNCTSGERILLISVSPALLSVDL